MEIITQTWDLKPKKGFTQTSILKNDKGFRISYEYNLPLGTGHCIEFKDCIIGAWGYMANKEETEAKAEWYNSYEECIATIEKQTKYKNSLNKIKSTNTYSHGNSTKKVRN